MEQMDMTYEQFCHLRPYKMDDSLIHCESELFHDPTNNRRLIKAYRYSNDIPWMETKLKAVKNLIRFTSEHDIPELLRPDGIVKVYGSFRASIIPILPGCNASYFLSTKYTSTKVKIEILKQIGTILKRINEADKTAAYGDVHEDNFLVDIGSAKKIDVSSIRTYGIDTESVRLYDSPGLTNFYLVGNSNIRYLDKYQADSSGIIRADYNTDLFCFIMMVLSVISGDELFYLIDIDEYKKYLDYLDKLGFDSNLLNSLLTIYDKDKDNISPLPYLGTIKKLTKKASLSSFRMH